MRKYVLGAILAVFLACFMSIIAVAEESGVDNLVVTITTDKEEYYKSDRITFHVELKNEAFFQKLSGIQIKEIVPDGYKLQFENLTDLDCLKARESLTLTMTAYNTKETGRIIISSIIAVVVIVGLLGWIWKMNRRMRRQTLASGMAVLLLSTSYLPMTVQAYDNVTEREVYKSVLVDGKEITFGIKLTYKPEGKVMPPITEEDITLSFRIWEDGPMMECLYEEWQKRYPNIKIEFLEYPVGESGSGYVGLDGTSESPDISWILGSPDFYIQKGYVQDLTEIWSLDPDTRNIIGGVNEFGLGCMGTDRRWAIPVRFYPAAAWLNMFFIENCSSMPRTDWSFEEMTDYVEALSSDDGSEWGLSEQASLITWYPIAADPECIGEFGWDGEAFDLTSWAEGMEIESEFRTNGYIAPAVLTNEEEQIYYPQDEGMVAIRLDYWWAWERYWNRSEMYDKNVYWVPYRLPHTEENQDSTTNLAKMEFGVISSNCEYVREAYEVLKFFCWGVEGWKYKLTQYDYIMANSVDEDGYPKSVSGFVSSPVSSCPITLDKEIWEKYIAMHPSDRKDPEGEEMGINRSLYFDKFFEYVQKANWTCNGEMQIAGFDSWLANHYFSAIKYGEYMGVEDAVFYGGMNPADYVKELTDSANDIYEECLELYKKGEE